jgi:ribosomal protein S18 acetylase RimI-like enzyme
MTLSIHIKYAELSDADLLSQWAQAMAMETEDKRLDEATVLAGVKAGIKDPQRARYFIAYINEEAVGTLMLTTEWSDWRDGFWWWIQSVYVSPSQRRQGVYRALYDYVYGLAQVDQTVCGIRLYVEFENVAAQRTYEALGMKDARYRVMEVSTKNYDT